MKHFSNGTLASLCLCASVLFTFCATADTVHAADTPHVEIIFIDDMGYGDIGPFGSEHPTPNFDRLAECVGQASSLPSFNGKPKANASESHTRESTDASGLPLNKTGSQAGSLRHAFTLDVRGLPVRYQADAREFVFANTARVEGEKAAWNRPGPYRDIGVRRIPAPPVDGKVTLRALVDRASLELFAGGGQAAASFVVVPETHNRRIRIDGNEELEISSLVVNELRSIWERRQ